MSTTVFEHSFYIGSYMSGILYGIELVMYFTTMRNLLRKATRGRGDRFFMIYSTILFMLVTIDISTNAVWGEQMWITYRDQPGGVPEFIATQVSVWYETLSSTSVVALIFLGDALLIYRCFILWSSNYYIIILPIITYLGAFSLAICELVSAGVPGGDFFAGKSVNFGVPYYAMSIGLNIVLTMLICGRLFYLSKWVVTALGVEDARLYTNIMTIMVESAAPYSLVGIMFLVPYARGSEIAIAFGQVWAKITCLAPQLIVLRVITRRAWDRDTIDRAGHSLSFATGVSATMQPTEFSEVPSSYPYLSGTDIPSPSSEKGSDKWGSGRSLQNIAQIV